MDAVSPAALQSPGAGAGAAEEADVPGDGSADADGGADVVGGADVASGLAGVVAGAVVGCACGSLGPHALSTSAAAAAVVMANPWKIR